MKKTRLQQTSIEVTVGALMLMTLLALGFFTIVLSHENVFVKSYQVNVEFLNVTGLLKGDKVYLQGVDVGRVKKMEIRDQRVMVALSLDYPVQLREGYRISVEPSSVLGGRFVSIHEGPADATPVPPEAKIFGTPPVDFISEASEAIKSVRSALEEGGVLGNLQTTMTNLALVSAGLQKGEGTLGKLLKDDALYHEIKDLASSLKTVSGRIERGEGAIGKLVNSDEVYNDLRDIASNLRKVSDRLEKGEGTLGRLLSSDDQLYTDAAAAAASLRNITEGIGKGEGTLGRLAKDDELYTQLNATLTEIRAAIDDIRETSPVTSFSSLFFGAF